MRTRRWLGRWPARSALSACAAVLAGLHYAPGSLADTASVEATGAASTTEVFLIPHQDDEVLTFGPVIATLTAAGHEVWVVSYTTGANSNECLPLAGVCTAARSRGLTEAAFVARRDRELLASAGRLGVPAHHVLLALAGPRPADRRATTIYLDEVVRAASARWPAATLYSLSYIDNHPDHRGMGLALLRAVESGRLAPDHARFGLDRRYWQSVTAAEASTAGARQHWRMAYGQPTDARLVRCSPGSACGRAVQAAVAAYFHPYGIGSRSVRRRLQITVNDPAALLHAVPSPQYRPQTFQVTSTYATRGGGIVVRGVCTVAAVAAATTLTDATALAAGLEGRGATRWLAEAGGVSVSLRPASGGAALAAAPAVVKHGGGFRASLALPVQDSGDADGGANVTASCWAGGMQPSTITVPMARIEAQVLAPHTSGAGAVLAGTGDARLVVRVTATGLQAPGRVFVQLVRRLPEPSNPCAVPAGDPGTRRLPPGAPALDGMPPAGSTRLLPDGSAVLSADLPEALAARVRRADGPDRPVAHGPTQGHEVAYAVTVWIAGPGITAPALSPITVTRT